MMKNVLKIISNVIAAFNKIDFSSIHLNLDLI